MKPILTNLFKKISLLVLCIFAVCSIYLNLPVVFSEKRTCIYIHPGESFNQFAQNVADKARYATPLALKIYAKWEGFDRRLKAGEYCFDAHVSIIDVVAKISRGKRELHKFTLVDGWTYAQMIGRLREAPSLSDTSILGDKLQLASHLDLAENNLEGQFYPDTYYYAYPDTALSILQQAHALMKQRVEVLYQDSETRAIFKTPYELLIAASVIQKEASDPIEQRLIAGVMINRIKHHMKLQMDPTVIYALDENYTPLLKKLDLRIDSPYNTYLYAGLPPTPICMPGETALYAAAHPQGSNYFYYVSKKDHTHQFSTTLEEQTQAIKKYLLSHNEKS